MIYNIGIVIPKMEVVRCMTFAERVVTTNGYYTYRNQNDTERIKEQIFIGKMGEVGTKMFLEKDGYPCSDVNFDITDNKTFLPDIVSCGNNIHVKSQDRVSEEMFGSSWTFQYGNGKSGHCDKEIFQNYTEKDYVSFCSVSVYDRKVIIKGVYKVSFLHRKDLFKDPKKKSLIGQKKVIYFSDLENLSR